MSYDLIDSKYPLFKVQFSVKPRPHFMIHPRRKNGVKYNGATSEDWEKLALAAKFMVEKYSLGKSLEEKSPEDDSTLVLSIHTDDFTTNKVEVHAHLCVDKEKYLKIFDQDYKRTEIDNIDQYKEEVNTGSFLSNMDDVKVIDNVIANIPEIEDPENVKLRNIATETLRKEGVSVFHHTEHPMIGFFFKKEPIDISKHIQKFMDYKDEYLKIYPNLGGEQGYQLCLSPCSKGYFPDVDHSKWNGETENLVLVAYILTSGYHFYQICPHDDREAWLKAYRKSKFEPQT